MKEDIDTVKDAVQEIIHLNSKAKRPIGLQRVLPYIMIFLRTIFWRI